MNNDYDPNAVQPVQAAPQQVVVVQNNAKQPGHGLGVASLVLGIISLVLFLTNWIAALFGLIGTVLGGVAKSKGNTEGVTKAGLVCSIIGLVLGLIIFISALACIGANGGFSSISTIF